LHFVFYCRSFAFLANPAFSYLKKRQLLPFAWGSVYPLKKHTRKEA